MTRASRKQWLSCVLAMIALVAPASALAEGRVALRWSAPVECPEGERVTGEVDRLLGDRSPPASVPLQVTASVSREASGGYVVRLETTGAGGSRVREIKGASCTAIGDATALIIALMIDPAAVSQAPPPVAPAPPSAPPPVPPAPREAPPVVPTPKAPPLPALASPLRPSFRVVGWGAADLGSLPGVSGAFGGKLALGLGHLRLEVGAGVWPVRSGYLAGSSTKGGTVGLAAGSAGACWSFLGPGPFELGPCVAFELGRLHADGFGVDVPSRGASLWSALAGGGQFAWSPARRVALLVRLDAVAPLARPTFVLSGLGPVHRPSAAIGRATTGVELRF